MINEIRLINTPYLYNGTDNPEFNQIVGIDAEGIILRKKIIDNDEIAKSQAI